MVLNVRRQLVLSGLHSSNNVFCIKEVVGVIVQIKKPVEHVDDDEGQWKCVSGHHVDVAHAVAGLWVCGHDAL